ncbi:FMN-binding negative transcriptional regulator [Cognatitamlana onchidii]|uniref:FMN-binding negative transcriptional regulator n=1 Tax=Cognatitamlana onchidii TaxID=2562860 RepID=UPI0010A64688|nr:FMN-binding negative transcriptional regulator [Algibacter onchidii]
MKYPPKHHQANNINHIIEVIKAYPLATIISVNKNTPIITHLPLMFEESGKLVGHIDSSNPQAALLEKNNPITVIFSGPNSYISPSIFKTSHLPTWNYIKVHLKGTVISIDNKELLKESLINLTSFLEAPDNKYVLSTNNPKMEMYLDYIKLFEITVLDWEGKFKLSQDKPKDDFGCAKEALISSNKKDIGEFLKKLQ